MTVIAAKKINNGKIHFAADSYCGIGWGEKNENKELDVVKLFNTNGITCGVTGNLYDANKFRLFCETTRPRNDSEIELVRFMADYMKSVNDKNSSTFIVAFGKQLYEINGLDVIQVKNFIAVGAGGSFARTAMYLGKNPKEAVSIACKLSPYCSKPIKEFFHSKA